MVELSPQELVLRDLLIAERIKPPGVLEFARSVWGRATRSVALCSALSLMGCAFMQPHRIGDGAAVADTVGAVLFTGAAVGVAVADPAFSQGDPGAQWGVIACAIIGAIYTSSAIYGFTRSPDMQQNDEPILGLRILALGLAGAGRGVQSQAQEPPSGSAAGRPLVVSPVRLLIFGGDGHQVFLGCLSCDPSDSDSVQNELGSHGSYSSVSILNHFGEYGSQNSSHSACNDVASDPPIVVDDNGGAYGRLTLNTVKHQFDDPRVIGWLEGVCRN